MFTFSLENNSIITVIGIFIGVAIFMGIGVQILGSVSLDCSSIDGYNSENPNDSTGWAGSCVKANNQTANAYSLLLVILIVVAAAAILFVVKLL